ncbi:hypothetical protein Poli38472_011430 [Pythium oligandrum]|uniref:Microsomal glutathione S-transferase 1 n=1 Tax=Pythium oligandrum TaxID=41045 RepID=A0A8K1CKX0_PYTOL|nr:hypothetical protein Poli38472_011430 [Pythium oligandrum]|eukprot:TMW64550.1 hypothetical protein Poli38472_011430 [Pythium oligandrum]
MMETVTTDVRVLAICAAVLYVKFLATTMIQGRKGFHAGTHTPEDSKLFCTDPSMPKQEGYCNAETVPAHLKIAYESEQRWKRIVQNDLESMPLAFIVFVATIAVGGNKMVTSVLMVAYTVARITHTIVYAKMLQPHRMIAWMSGIFCVLAVAVNGVLAALTK